MVKHIIIGIFTILLVLFYTGCSGSRTVETNTGPATQNRDEALELYLKGQTLDQQENYAAAILEYQDALRRYEEPSIYYAMAKDYLNLGKNDLAIEAAANSVRLEPDNISFRETLAEIFARDQRFTEAIQQYKEIIRRDSSKEEDWHVLASVLEANRAPMEALDICNQILDRFGPDENLYIQMIELNGMLGKPNETADAMKGLLALDPTNLEVKKSLGDLYMQMDSVNAALKLYNELVELHPKDITLRASIAYGYLEKHDYGKAREQFDSLMTRDTLSIDDELDFGRVFISHVERDSGVIPVAEDLFNELVKQHPDDWRPHWFLGALADVRKDDSTAVLEFKKVTELAKWNPDGWVEIASRWYDKGEMQKALDVLEEALKNVKEEFRIQFIYGLTLERMKRPADAAAALEHAIQLNPKSADAYSALGLVYDELKRPADSDSMYEHALGINPDNDLVLNNYGYNLADRGVKLDRAETMIKKALQKQPNNSSYLDSMGWVYFKLGNYSDAERFEKKAIDIGPANAVLYEHLGDVYSKLNQKDKAQENWKKALELDSNNQSLKAKIERGTL